MIGSALLVLCGMLAQPGLSDEVKSSPDAPASQITFLGWPREISKSSSASRDAPVFAMSLYPRDIRTAAGEFSLVTIPTAHITLRNGFYGLIELERPDKVTGFGFIFPQASGHFFWRAAFGAYAAASFDSLARKLCSRCGLEASFMIRHESEHTTQEQSGDPEMDFHDRPIVGDGLVLDAAGRWASDRWVLTGRLQNQFFIPGQSGYSQGPGIDVHARFKAGKRLHLIASGYAEVLFGAQVNRREYPDAHLVRGLLGVALPSAIGDIEFYLTGDSGHRRGLLVYTEERTLGMGIRLALGPVAKD